MHVPDYLLLATWVAQRPPSCDSTLPKPVACISISTIASCCCRRAQRPCSRGRRPDDRDAAASLASQRASRRCSTRASRAFVREPLPGSRSGVGWKQAAATAPLSPSPSSSSPPPPRAGSQPMPTGSSCLSPAGAPSAVAATFGSPASTAAGSDSRRSLAAAAAAAAASMGGSPAAAGRGAPMAPDP
eukprot:99029-Chlamydomonas_euryale.AAC.2